MRIYVASKLENTDVVRKAQSICRTLGHTITHDWTEDLVDLVKPLTHYEVDRLMSKHAILDLEGARTADLLILIAHPGMKGALVEMGIALGAGARVVIVGSLDDVGCGNIFEWHLDTVDHIASIKDLKSYLKPKI